jgi:hypothetical protein
VPKAYGSFGPFSDRFRYKLLHERGGIWCDSDMVCLKPLDFAEAMPYVFASERIAARGEHAQGGVKLASAFIKTPPGSALMADCLATAMPPAPADIVWSSIGPDLLQRMVIQHQLSGHVVQPQVFCPIDYWRFQDLFTGMQLLPDDAYGVHLWHEMWRRQCFDKNQHYDPLSLYERLRRRYLPSG